MDRKREKTMRIHVLLSGRLKLDGYGDGCVLDDDGTYRLDILDGASVFDVIQDMHVPPEKVTMTMLNGRKCQPAATLKSADRVVLIPEDVAAMWRFLGIQNLGIESVLDF
jgi:hypothetical protein